MRFGDIPMWALELSSSIRKVVLFSDHVGETMPSDLLWREPLFDQLIVNVYQPGEVRYNFTLIPLYSALYITLFGVLLTLADS